MLEIFNKKSARIIEKSIERYEEILKNDENLRIRIRYRGHIYISYVQSIEKKEILFLRPNDEFTIVRFSENSIIKVELISKNKIFTTEVLIIGKLIKDDKVYYKAELSAPLYESSKRKSYRLPIIIDMSYTILPMESQRYTGSTLDISTGGMLIETEQLINKGKEINLSIDLDGKIYLIKGIILNKRSNYRNGTYLYNIKFTAIKNRHRNDIERFINNNRSLSN